MTYSIVARDREAGLLGVAVQSRFFGVGRVVPWVEAGVGAIATQSFVEPAYGARGLELLREGRSATAALAELVAADPSAASRQVAIIGVHGELAVHTGADCVGVAGQRIVADASAQGNMLSSDAVLDALIDAYESARGEFAERLLAGMDAAEAAGGDVRGRQSAALLVVDDQRSVRPWDHVRIDVRVDDHGDPLGELRRLARANAFYVDLLSLLARPGLFAGPFSASAPDVEQALARLADGARALDGNPDPLLWHGILLARGGRMDEARAVVREATARQPSLETFVQRLADAGFLSASEAAQLTSTERLDAP